MEDRMGRDLTHDEIVQYRIIRANKRHYIAKAYRLGRISEEKRIYDLEELENSTLETIMETKAGRGSSVKKTLKSIHLFHIL